MSYRRCNWVWETLRAKYATWELAARQQNRHEMAHRTALRK